ncbi:MAG TPA: ABC transporter permease [Rhodothermales bacterium]|nr:ABC transporter permease [Rhodothermales bacterium]
MKWIALALKNLLRNPRRTLLTMGAVTLALFIFTTLQTVLSAIQMQQGGGMGEVRLAVIEKYGGPRTELPVSYGARLGRFEHVIGVTPLNFTIVTAGGTSGPFYITFAVDPEGYRDCFTSITSQIPPSDYAQFIKLRNGALIGADIMRQYGWQVGDHIKLNSLLNRITLDLVITGVLQDETGANQQVSTQVVVNEAYYDAVRDKGGKVNLFWLRIDDARNILPVVKQVTDYYANGPMEVAVQTEGSMIARFGQFTASIQLVIKIISIAVLFTVLIVTANTIALSMRERRKEIAVMKAMGYTREGVLGLVILEAVMTSLLAGMAGTALAWGLFQMKGLMLSFGVAFNFVVTPQVMAAGLAISVGLGVVSGLVPAYRTARVNVIRALRSI